jgi:hypothetical protein
LNFILPYLSQDFMKYCHNFPYASSQEGTHTNVKTVFGCFFKPGLGGLGQHPGGRKCDPRARVSQISSVRCRRASHHDGDEFVPDREEKPLQAKFSTGCGSTPKHHAIWWTLGQPNKEVIAVSQL